MILNELSFPFKVFVAYYLVAFKWCRIGYQREDYFSCLFSFMFLDLLVPNLGYMIHTPPLFVEILNGLLIYTGLTLFCRNTMPPDSSTQLDVSQDQSVSKSKSEEIPNKQVTFSELSNTNGIDDPDMEINQNDREPSVSWASKSSPYATALEDPISTYSPYLPPVMEEPTSSFSEGESFFFNSLLLMLLRILQLDVI